MRWTSDADAHLLVKILEVMPGTVDVRAVANIWNFGGERPTPKAISERIGKLKRIGKGGAGGNGPSSVTSTPKTPKTPKTSVRNGTKTSLLNDTPSHSAKFSGKRKRVIKSEHQDDDDYGDDSGDFGTLDGGLGGLSDVKTQEDEADSTGTDSPRVKHEQDPPVKRQRVENNGQFSALSYDSLPRQADQEMNNLQSSTTGFGYRVGLDGAFDHFDPDSLEIW